MPLIATLVRLMVMANVFTTTSNRSKLTSNVSVQPHQFLCCELEPFVPSNKELSFYQLMTYILKTKRQISVARKAIR